MQFLSRLVGRWPIALACVVALAAAVLLPGLGTFGLWEPQERQLADKIAPRDEIAAKLAKDQPAPLPDQPNKPACERVPPKDAVARSLTNRAMVWGRDNLADSDAGRRLPLALLGLLTVLAAAGIAMRVAGPRAGVLTALVLVSMPLLVFQSRQLLSEVGVPAGGALTLYGLVALGTSHARSRVLALIDTVVALLALGAGCVISFVAGGALLGLLVPIGAYAAATGLGVGALGGLGRAAGYAGLTIGRRIRPRWAAGRSIQRPTHVFAWIEIAVAFALIGAGVVMLVLLRDDGAPVSNAYGFFAAAALPLVHGGFVLARDQNMATRIELAKGLFATFAVIGIVGLLAYQLYSLEEPMPGLVPAQRAVMGKAIVPTGCWSSALGAIWRPEDDLRYSFDSTMEQIGYGTFPWGIVGPIAIFALLASVDRRRRLVGGITLAWAAGAWVAAEVFQRRVGFTLYSGFPALAIAIGVWLDGVLVARAQRDRDPDATSTGNEIPTGALILVGLFVLLAVIDMGKDLQSFPERISSLLVGSDQIAYPKMSKLAFVPTKLWILILGSVMALGFSLSMIVWRDVPRRALARQFARRGIGVALGFTAVFAAFWAFAWQPALATHLSSKNMFDTYTALRKPGDQLVIMGDMGDAAYAYAPESKPELVSTRDLIVAAIGRPNRVFAIAPQTELCQLHREIAGKPYYVIDDRNTRSLLISNKVDGTTDKNPLRTSILHEEPKQIGARPKGRVVFDNKVELLGWTMPRAVGRGDKFTVKMYYKILQPVGGNWRILFHFDGPLRFNGDHEPIAGRCQTATWQPGDFIVDTYTVTAGAGAFTPGPYEVWTGFFTGSAPNWKNMTVSEAPPDMRDTVDRVKITSITLQ